MIKCYFLDDEQNAIDAILAMMQKKFSNQVDIVGYNIDAQKAIAEIKDLNIDVLFLDVEMPKLNGLDFLKHFPTRTFQVIFTTAHEKYALPALKAAATDYLVKPLSPLDVNDAIQKIKLRLSNKVSSDEYKLTLHTTKETSIVNIKDIVRIEANNNYSYFYFVSQPKLLVSKTLKEFEEQLIMHNFYRIHQSHLINLKYLQAVTTKDGDFAIMTNDDKIEISRRRKPELMLKLKSI
jgi:two-component system, LytTR family, response regulator